MGPELSHLDNSGNVRMVDVSGKPDRLRTAVARGAVSLAPGTLSLILEEKIPKGNVLTTARVAGIMAAKKTGDTIPLCHPLNVGDVAISFSHRRDGERARVDIESRVKLVGKTGAEMEALTAVAVAALTLYDMCKAVDRDMTITDIHLVEKTGGKSKTTKNAK